MELTGGHEPADALVDVWVFNGSGGQFPSGVFSALDKLESWVAKYNLTGTATLYRLDVGAYDWSVDNGWFKPKEPRQREPDFIGRFSGGERHHHYESGVREA